MRVQEKATMRSQLYKSDFLFGSLFALLAATASLANPSTALGDELFIAPSKDATIFLNNSDDQMVATANGSGLSLFVGLINAPPSNPNSIRRAIVAFDPVAALQALNIQPYDVLLNTVELEMRVTKEASGPDSVPMSLHRATSPWTEGPSGAGSATGNTFSAGQNDATWYYSSFSNQRWNQAGGDFEATPSATSPVGATSMALWTSDEMLADVQQWLDHPETNHGWFLIGDEVTRQSVKRLSSVNDTVSSNRPSLLLNFTPLVPGDIDGNSKVNISDFAILRANFNKSVGSRGEGDLNRDGAVNIGDFAILRANFNRMGAVVPEPSSLGLLSVVGVISVSVFLRKQR